MGGGSGMPICISTCAIAGMGITIANARNNVPKNNFFILLPPIKPTALYPFSPPVQLCGCLYGSPSADDSNQDYHDGDHQKDVDKAAHGVGSHQAKEPQYYQDNNYSP